MAQTAKRALPLPTGDIVTVQCRFQSGATGLICAISSTPYYGRFTVFGTEKWMEVRDEKHPQDGGQAQLITCGKDGILITETIPITNAVLANLEEWADAITGKGNYRFTDFQRISNIAVLEAITQSVNSGKWVEVAL